MRYLGFACSLLTLAAAARPVLADSVGKYAYERWVPKDAVLVLALDDLARTKERFSSGALKTLWEDPALADLRRTWTEVLGKKNDQGIEVEKLLDLPKGRILIAMADWESEAMVGFMDVAGNERTFEQYMRKLDEEDGTRVREFDFRGLTIHVRERDGEDIGGYSRDGSLVVFADNTDILRETLRRRAADDPEQSVLASASYKAARARVDECDLFAYLRFGPLLRKAGNNIPPAVLDAFGIRSLESVAIGLDLREDGVRMRAFTHAPGRKRGLLRIIAGKNADLSPPRLLPPDTAWGFVLNLDLQAAIDEALRIADAVQPGASALAMAQIKKVERDVGINVAKDVIGPLSGRIAAYGMGERAWNTDDGKGVVVLLGLDDKDRFVQTLDTVFRKFGLPVGAEDFLGMRIRTFMNVVAWSFATGSGIFAPDIDGVRKLLLRHGKDLKGPWTSRAHQRMRAALPETCSLLLWIDPRAASGLFDDEDDAEAEGPGDEFDKMLGSVESLVRYLSAVGIAVRNEEDGLSVTYYIGIEKPGDD